ncbi:MAG: hypothetical protein R3E51_11300 [Rhizobiaceae bacterium]
MNLGDRIKGFSPVAARLPPFCFCFDGVRIIAAFGDDSPRLIDGYSVAACESAGFEFRVLHSGRLTAGSAGRTIFRADQHSRSFRLSSVQTNTRAPHWFRKIASRRADSPASTFNSPGNRQAFRRLTFVKVYGEQAG